MNIGVFMMKRMTVFAALLLFVCAAASYAAGFEGKVVYQVNTGGRTTDVTVYAKDQKTRTELVGPQGQDIKMVTDLEARTAYMLLDDQKMAMKMPLELPARVAETIERAKPERTGKTKTILGRECEQIIVKNQENMIEIWSAKGLGSFNGILGRSPGGTNSGLPDMSAFTGLEEFFPMAVTVRDKTGRQTFSMEAKSVEPQQLADNMVSVPSDYQMVTSPPGYRLQSKSR